MCRGVKTGLWCIYLTKVCVWVCVCEYECTFKFPWSALQRSHLVPAEYCYPSCLPLPVFMSSPSLLLPFASHPYPYILFYTWSRLSFLEYILPIGGHTDLWRIDIDTQDVSHIPFTPYYLVLPFFLILCPVMGAAEISTPCRSPEQSTRK